MITIHMLSRQAVQVGMTLALCGILIACGSTPKYPVSGSSSIATATGAGTYKIGNPYKIAGSWYTPREDPYYDQVGIASWYGKKFNGRSTANGEIFDMNQFSAAHKTLPLPSFVKVTNLQNGRHLVVRVNDRGPFVHDRIIDLSRRAARELGFLKQGTTQVRVEMVRNQIGERFVVPKGTTSAEERKSVVAVPAIAVESQLLASPEDNTSAPPQTGRTLLYVQAGAFSKMANAHKLRDRLNDLGTVAIAPVQIGITQYYRVRVGPMDTIESADQTLTQLINSGHPDARIVVDMENGGCRLC